MSDEWVLTGIICGLECLQFRIEIFHKEIPLEYIFGVSHFYFFFGMLIFYMAYELTLFEIIHFIKCYHFTLFIEDASFLFYIPFDLHLS